MTALRVLGLCGLLASALSAAGGFLNIPELVGLSGLTMLLGNLYASWRGV